MVKSFTKIFVLFTLIALIATSIPLSAWVTYIMIWYKKFLDWNIADFVIINVFGYSFIFLILTSSIRIIWMFIELLTLKHNNDLILLEDKIKNSELSNLQLNFENIYKINFDNNEINRYIMYPKTLKIKNVSKYSKLITYWNAIQPYEKCELVDFDNQLLTFGNIYDEFKKYDWFKNI
ncbi:hypothetical protein [Mycoplasmopsis felifaucium]|uniref:hypothetical protein n=1 Tax=Mycoplasmopsis felifaucium TaxID=35768 RepID=UPI0012EB5481|nr:hypothetical protein [Mycoplasmopsis felifaucium]